MGAGKDRAWIEPLELRRLLTVLPLLDINQQPGSSSTTASSIPFGGMDVGSLRLFVAEDGNGGRQVYRSDGTAAGTTALPGVTIPGNGYAGWDAASLGGKLYFAGDDTSFVRGLWSTDGTAAGTAVISAVLIRK